MENNIPAPLHYELTNERMVFTEDTISVEFSDDSLEDVALKFCNEAERRLGVTSNTGMTDEPAIIVDLADDERLNALTYDGTGTDERYSIEVDTDHIYVTGKTIEGVDHGLTSLLILLDTANKDRDGHLFLPGMLILDGPRSELFSQATL
jgi:N-acetyl-beta-hexosaminidase